jgi:hypothetical protein
MTVDQSNLDLFESDMWDAVEKKLAKGWSRSTMDAALGDLHCIASNRFSANSGAPYIALIAHKRMICRESPVIYSGCYRPIIFSMCYTLSQAYSLPQEFIRGMYWGYCLRVGACPESTYGIRQPWSTPETMSDFREGIDYGKRLYATISANSI